MFTTETWVVFLIILKIPLSVSLLTALCALERCFFTVERNTENFSLINYRACVAWIETASIWLVWHLNTCFNLPIDHKYEGICLWKTLDHMYLKGVDLDWSKVMEFRISNKTIRNSKNWNCHDLGSRDLPPIPKKYFQKTFTTDIFEINVF